MPDRTPALTRKDGGELAVQPRPSTGPEGHSWKRHQYPVRMPAGFDAAVQGIRAYVRLSCPLCDGPGSAVDRDEVIASPVVRLFDLRHPAAVAWLVITPPVNAVDLVLWRRPQSHVGQEVLELVPALTDCDSASAIVFVAYVAWITAAVEHTVPCHVFGGFVPFSGVPMGDVPFGLLPSMFPMQASAGASSACRHRPFCDYEIIAAIASEQPRGSLLPAVLRDETHS